MKLGGGTERIVVDLAKYLTRNNHDVSILTFDMLGSSSFYPIDDRVKRHDIGIGDTRRKSGVNDTFRRIFAMRQVIFIERPDIVVGFMHSMYVPLAVSLIGTGFPIVGSEHIVPQHYEKRRLEYLFVHLSTFLIDRFTVLSETIRKSYGSFFRRKAIIMPNPVKKPELNKTQKKLTG